MRQLLTSLVITLLLTHLATAATVYKWADENGQIHYSGSPPPQEKAQRLDIKVPSYTGPPEVASVTIEDSTESASVSRGAQNVTVYTTSWCGVCKRAKAYLERRGLPYTERDIEASSSARREFEQLNGRGVPVIVIGDQRMTGFSEARLERMLQKYGS